MERTRSWRGVAASGGTSKSGCRSPRAVHLSGDRQLDPVQPPVGDGFVHEACGAPLLGVHNVLDVRGVGEIHVAEVPVRVVVRARGVGALPAKQFDESRHRGLE